MQLEAPDGRRTSWAMRRASIACVALAFIMCTASAAGAADGAAAAASATITTIPGGRGTGVGPVGTETAVLEAGGYTETELLASGVAHIYSGPATAPATVTSTTVPYTTRVVVREPSDAKDFSGRVMVEPMNTSGGGDVAAAWGFIGDDLVRNGDAWVGVTVRSSSDPLLKQGDPVRYASINLPTNSVAWDVLAQVGRSVRDDSSSLLGELEPKHVYMSGYSQSAIDVATYASAINAVAEGDNGKPVFDGFLVMARAASLTPTDPGTAALPKFEFAPIGKASSPVIDVESEGEQAGFTTPVYSNPAGATVRRADSDSAKDRFRLYEITGGSHVQKGSGCDHPDGTTFPMQYFEHAALAHLYAWAERGTKPPKQPRITATDIGPVTTFAKDEHGNSVGGVRSPFVDVPYSTYGSNDGPGPLCALAGYETPLPAATLQAEYTNVDGYMKKLTKSLDRAIASGALSRADRADIISSVRKIAQQRFSGT